MTETLETNLADEIARRVSVSLLDSLLWGHELEKTSPKPSPSSPSSPRTVYRSPMRQPSHFWATHEEAYGWRAHVAMDAICAIPAPPGLIVWLSERSPFIYRRLTDELPNEISRAWNESHSV